MKKLNTLIIALLLSICLSLSACGLSIDIGNSSQNASISKNSSSQITSSVQDQNSAIEVDGIGSIPPFENFPYVILNNNQPYFTKDDLTTQSYEFYSPLDSLGRCGVTIACIGKDIMPTEARGEIGMVKPTGWQTVKYDIVSGKYLYNRCHLIGFQLAGENANNRNLITGTRYLNVDGMLPFENMVADYVKETNNHVLYRVVPIFIENELVARGVTMEGYSVEDNGDGICFNIFCYNNQPGITIDYMTGNSVLSGEELPPRSDNLSSVSYPDEQVESGSESQTSQITYVLNTSTKKIHMPWCSSVSSMKEQNRLDFYGEFNEIPSGYTPCGTCKPQ